MCLNVDIEHPQNILFYALSNFFIFFFFFFKAQTRLSLGFAAAARVCSPFGYYAGRNCG